MVILLQFVVISTVAYVMNRQNILTCSITDGIIPVLSLEIR